MDQLEQSAPSGVIPNGSADTGAGREKSVLQPNGRKSSSTRGKRFGWNTVYGAEDPSPYLTRVWIGRLRLHIFHRGDHDKDLHNHPWGFWTFPFVSYVEEVAENVSSGNYRTRRQIVRALRWHYRPATHTHRVLGAWTGKGLRFNSRERITTLVWRGRAMEWNWGFLKNRNGRWCWQPWREYLRDGGKNAPCD